MRIDRLLAVVAAAAVAMTAAALLVGGPGTHCASTSDYFPFLSNARGYSTPGGALTSWLDAEGEEAPDDAWDRESAGRGVVQFHNGPWEVVVMRAPAGGFTVASTTCAGFFP
jgi:hypothetical protein